MKKFRYLLEAMLLHMLFVLFSCLSAKKASDLGGFLGRSIGPHLSVNRKARRHIKNALPQKSFEEQELIIRGMWDNLGRVIAEYPHLKEISNKHTQIIGADYVQEYLKTKRPIVFIGAHLANWEINCAATYTQLGHSIDLTYRAPNNPWIDKLLEKCRTLSGRLKAFPKSRDSARLIMQSLKEKRSLGILIDQKFNEGVDVRFFDQSAMTNPIFVRLCQKYNCPLVPVRNERVNGCEFKLTVYKPIPVFNEDGSPREIEDVIKDAHNLLESWIIERPEQWIWLHRRWKS